MWNLRASFFMAILLCALGSFAQQDLLRNQYMYDLYLANPAFAGNEQGLSTTLTYRKQWAGFTGAPVSQTLSLHAPDRSGKMGFGISLVNDKIGPRTVTGFNGTYSYRVRLGPGKLSFGINAGLLNYNYDLSKIDYRDQQDEIVLNGRESNLVPNFDAGLLYYTRSSYFGVSAYHLNRSKLNVYDASESRQYLQLVLVAGHAFNLSDDLVFKPTALFRSMESGQSQLDINAEFKIADVLGLVVGYRSGYGGMAMVYANIKKNFRLGYSYDLPMNELVNQASGSHEVFLSYDLDIYKQRSASPRLP